MEEGFLQSIVEEPEEMSPRLVYADWLEERGDLRADFIRVQIALSELTQNSEVGTELTRESSDLLQRFGRRWNAEIHRRLLGTPLCNKVGRRQAIRQWRYARGFPEYLRLEDWVLRDHANLVSKISPFRVLHVFCRSNCLEQIVTSRLVQRATKVTFKLHQDFTTSQLEAIDESFRGVGLPQIRFLDQYGQALLGHLESDAAEGPWWEVW